MAEAEKKEVPEIHRASWYQKPLDYKVIIYEPNHETHVAKITLNRPEVMNALSHQLRGELFHALKVAEGDNDINVVVLKGAGRCFSAGYDLAEGIGGSQEPDMGSQYVGASHWARYLTNLYWQIWELSKVVIAQTHGYVLAGGSELCSMCDLLVTTPDCQFGYPPMRAMPAPDVMWFPWLLPMRKAKEMLFTGDSITGEEVYRLGMANYCVPEKDIDEFTEVFAKRVALIPWQMHTLRKRSINKVYEMQGMRSAMEISAMMWQQYQDVDRVKQMEHMLHTAPLREYLTARDKPYKDYRTAEDAILKRAAREGEEWKGVSGEVKGSSGESKNKGKP